MNERNPNLRRVIRAGRKNAEAAAAEKLREAEAKVKGWNETHPIGTRVMRYKLINPLSDGEETKTRSKAWVMGGHSAMVMVERVAGGVILESVVPLP